jgi:hypothetical protein
MGLQIVRSMRKNAPRNTQEYVRKNSEKSGKMVAFKPIFYPVSVVLIIAKTAKDFMEQGSFAAAA